MLFNHIKPIFLSIILISYWESACSQAFFWKGGWSLGQSNNTGQNMDPSCTRPQIVVEEDFTDSLFNGFNAGPNGANWEFFAGGVAFRRPNNRTTFPLAVARNPFISAGGWAGVKWGNKINPALGHSEANLREYKIDKKDDVFITRFRGFSDFAHRNERAGIEVANMEWRNVLCPHPDYCHDLSFEAKQNFYSRAQDDLQLETNVENTTDRSQFSAKRTHYNNLTTKADLNKEYDNLVVWRNDSTKRKTNIEQWGAANYGDFWLDTHMVSKLDARNRYAIISEVQVSLFAGDTNFTLYRDGIDKNKAHIGILNVHSGITKCADFNLDYKINEADVDILKQYLGRTDSATIRRGDANNDSKITAQDCNAVTAFWSDSTMHPDSASAKVFFTPVTNQPGVIGNFRFNLQNISYISYKLPAGASIISMPNNMFESADVVSFNNAQGETYFFKKDGYNLENFQVGLLGASGSVNVEDVVFTVNYLGSCQSGGFSFKADSAFVFTETGDNLEALSPIVLAGTTFQVPASAQELELTISELLGRSVSTYRFSKSASTANNMVLPVGVSFLTLRNVKTGKILGRQKAMRLNGQ